jgi:hypothetical protein
MTSVPRKQRGGRDARRQERGQAVVELALGALVLVSIIAGGIYFAEFGFMWVKVEEAANFALFDQTNRKLHDMNAGTWNGLATAPGSPVGALNSQVTRRYQDFDGLSSVTRDATFSQVFTRGTNLTVRCTRVRGPNIDVAGAGAGVSDPFGAAAAYNAGISCQASAVLHLFRFPQSFADGANGVFRGNMIDGTQNPKQTAVCAAGRASGGNCNGKGFQMVLDDWGLQGRAESGECHLTNSDACGNPGFYRLAEKSYRAIGGAGNGAASNLAEQMVGFAPTHEGPFWMSFRGEESKFTEEHPSDGDTKWPTTPFDDPQSAQTYKKAYDKNRACFLGSRC